MIKKLSFTNYPKVVTDLATQNHYLKILTYAMLGIFSIMMISLVLMASRGPEVIALETSGKPAKIGNTITENHVQAAIEEYLSYRYNWNNSSIDKQLKLSEGFIYPSLLDSFRKSMVEVKRFVQNKNLTQRVYVQKIEVDLKKKIVSMVADRINEFDSLKAATVLKVKFQIDLGSPTAINPWGVYVTKETESAGGE
jgi:hypothetical protein